MSTVERKKRIGEVKREQELMEAVARRGELMVLIEEETKKMKDSQKKRSVAGRKKALEVGVQEVEGGESRGGR